MSQVQICHFLGWICPSKGLTQEGEGIGVGAGSPWQPSRPLLATFLFWWILRVLQQQQQQQKGILI